MDRPRLLLVRSPPKTPDIKIMSTKILPSQISLIPLTGERHAEALQRVYRRAGDYWAMHGLTGAPNGQAARDLETAAATPGRTMMGIVRVRPQEEGGVALIGVVDFRLHWPDEGVAYVGMIMVAAPYRRQGIGSQAWGLLAPWLAGNADVQTARCGIEQFNLNALKFFRGIGFELTGEANRMRAGDKLVRLLYMEQPLG